MATVSPFKALRFTKEAGPLAELVCPPYDIISERERAGYLSQNPRNIIRLELPKDGEDPYAAAGEALQAWLADGTLACAEKPAFYLYEEEFTAHGQKKKLSGIVCRVGLEPFETGVVLPHEETLSKAKADRYDLMKATNCNFSSIYSLYFDEKREIAFVLDKLYKTAPDEVFTTEDGIVHRIWDIEDENITARISALFADKKLYIADGHHRYETALKYMKDAGQTPGSGHPCASVMMTLVDIGHEGLVVFPTHRIIRGLENFSREDLLKNCAAYFKLEDIGASDFRAKLDGAAERGEKAFALYCGGQYTLLTLLNPAVMDTMLPGTSAAYRGLDVNILHTLILEQLLSIDKENMANQKNLIYTRDPSEAVSGVDSGEADCAFLINPTKVPEIAAVAGAGEKMPQKSTYFYPKLITGHIMNRLV